MKRFFSNDYFISIALFATALVSRIPFHDRILFFWDSGDFALALERFDLAKQQPHPPGYLFYIAIAHIFNFVLKDANNALVALSILGGSISIVIIFFVGKSIFGRDVGITAAILLLFSPLAWFYSEVALAYEVELPLVLAAVWFLYQMYYFRRYAIATALLLGLAAGIRQDILLFLGPFFLIASTRVGVRFMLLSWAAMAVAITTWFIPITFSVGGISTLRFLYANQFDIAIRPTSILALGPRAVINNGKEIIKAALWLFGITILVPVLMGIQRLKGSDHWRAAKPDRRAFFIMVLMLPAFIYFLFIQCMQPSYIVSYIAPLLLVTAYMIVLAVKRLTELNILSRFRPEGAAFNLILVGVLTLVSASHIYLFVNGLDTKEIISVNDGYDSVFSSYSVKGLRNSEENMFALIIAVRQFDPEKTVVFCNNSDNLEDWRRLMYYLPEYRVVGLIVSGPWAGKEYLDANNHEMRVQQSSEIDLLPGQQQALFIDVVPEGGDVTSKTIVFSQDNSIMPISVVNLTKGIAFKVGFYYFTFDKDQTE